MIFQMQGLLGATDNDRESIGRWLTYKTPVQSDSSLVSPVLCSHTAATDPLARLAAAPPGAVAAALKTPLTLTPLTLHKSSG
jgi:hypothetical protein